MIEGILGYRAETDRFGLLVGDLWKNNDGFHCGDSLKIKINGEWIKTRIEMTVKGDWYLCNTKLHGMDLNMLPARIET